MGRSLGQALLNTACLPIAESAFNNFANHQSESTSNTSGTVKAVYRWNPELLTYISYAKGFKAGGFNLDRISCPNAGGPLVNGPCPTVNGRANGLVVSTSPVTNTFFKPEYSDSGEVGAKTTLFDRKLLLNATLFYEKFSNFQDNTYNGLVFVAGSLPTFMDRISDVARRNTLFEARHTMAIAFEPIDPAIGIAHGSFRHRCDRGSLHGRGPTIG